VRERPADPPSLLARLRAGDPAAFEDLVRAYQHRVFSVAVRMLGSRAEAEEIAQEVFVRVHRSIGGFRGDAALSTWLYAITSRLCLTHLASPRRRVPHHGEEVLVRLRDDRSDPPSTLERREVERLLHRAIAELPDDRRIVLVLRDLEGLAYEEIAEALDLEVGTVKSRLHRARMELRERLEKVTG
jgi:RNA polymerase sigma-70 factor (ECF subfamily)